MTWGALVMVAAGVLLIATGYRRAKRPWARYQMLKAQQENVARYESWRGGVRTDDGPTGASVAMEEARREAMRNGVIAIAGFLLVLQGFLAGGGTPS